MVLWGQSAGATAVDAYAYANPHDPIVSGLIADSGAVSPTNTFNTTPFTNLAESVGCGDLDEREEFVCVQKVDWQTIQNILQTNRSSGTTSPTAYYPVADNVTVFANNTERLEKGLVAKIVRQELCRLALPHDEKADRLLADDNGH